MMPISRSVDTYRPRAAVLAIVTGLGAILGVLASPGGASPKAADPSTAESRRIGMNSCGGRGCHGAVGAVKPTEGDVYIKDGASTTWLYFDPHAKAYDVLLDDRSVEIAKHLKIPQAHKSDLCLSCHSTTSPPEGISPAIDQERNGIDCEACHGGAEKWLDAHLDPAWRAKPAAIKARDGLNDLSTPAARAATCVECHVGHRSRGMDMNHDLIAAGHPRLNFEFASYQAAYPKHWKEQHEKARAKGEAPAGPVDFEAKSWAVGQVLTVQAMLELLAARAGVSEDARLKQGPAPEAVWPEFSESECFACHHDLSNPSPFQNPGHIKGKAGRLPWQTWPLAMLPDLAKDRDGINLDAPDSPLARLRVEMNRTLPDAKTVADLSGKSVLQLNDLLKSLEAKPIDVASLMKELASRPPVTGEGWDRRAQQYLALSALIRAAGDLDVPVGPEVEAAIRARLKGLQFPSKYDSPHGVAPSAAPKP